MVNIGTHQIGQIVKLSQKDSDPKAVLEGLITDVKHASQHVFDEVKIGDEWIYSSDWATYDVVEKDGKRLPTEVGVYRVIDELYQDEDEFVQLDNEGHWWPYPYSFSGWRTGELLGFDGLELVPELEVDYPVIKNPEEEAQYLQLMGMKARIWQDGYEANRRGDQAFTNPFKVCSVCFGLSGEHNESIHARQV